ncbi:MAG: MarR family winged helix-turn-helix transcriptional regulator [Acidimicrobiia bacterium]
MSSLGDRTRERHREPGLGILAARLLFAIQDELYARLEEAGHGQLTRLHGAVIAHLDEGGTRATELARRSGRHKQVIGRVIDELEALGYVERRPERVDRRAKLVVPTERGRDVMRLSDEIVRGIERRQAAALGKAAYDDFRRTLRAVVDSLARPAEDESSEAR